MKGGNLGGAVIVLGLIGIILLGGLKNKEGSSSFKPSPPTVMEVTPPPPAVTNPSANPPKTPQQQITELQKKVDDLKKQIDAEQAKQFASEYKDSVDLSFIVKSSDPAKEYLTIRVVKTLSRPIKATGWSVRSSKNGTIVYIPTGTYYYLNAINNTEEDVYLDNKDTLYLISGTSPIGTNFKSSKCTGYLNHLRAFTPTLKNNCPLARNEDLSSISRTEKNEQCLSYIESIRACRVQTTTLPSNWSVECKRFIFDKLNYSSCLNVHRNDSNFFGDEWMIYLKRNTGVWSTSRDTLTLYDEKGRIVDTLNI